MPWRRASKLKEEAGPTATDAGQIPMFCRASAPRKGHLYKSGPTFFGDIGIGHTDWVCRSPKSPKKLGPSYTRDLFGGLMPVPKPCVRGGSQPIIAGVRIRIWVGLKILVPAKSSLEREILPGRILSPRKDWKDSGRNLQIPPVASGNYRL